MDEDCHSAEFRYQKHCNIQQSWAQLISLFSYIGTYPCPQKSLFTQLCIFSPHNISHKKNTVFPQDNIQNSKTPFHRDLFFFQLFNIYELNKTVISLFQHEKITKKIKSYFWMSKYSQELAILDFHLISISIFYCTQDSGAMINHPHIW